MTKLRRPLLPPQGEVNGGQRPCSLMALSGHLSRPIRCPTQSGHPSFKTLQERSVVIISIRKCRDSASATHREQIRPVHVCSNWAGARASGAIGINYSGGDMSSIGQRGLRGEGTWQWGRSDNKRLRQAVHRHKRISKQGIQERLFTLVFSGLVYPQIWEDPLVDLEALCLKDDEHLVAIASGGCN